MKLNDECLDSLKFRAFWEKETRPSIMRFLTYRLLSSELEDEETEHSYYSSELHKISLHYPDANSDIGRKVAKLKRTFKKTKNSKQIKQFWELHMAKERAALENQATKTISELQINTLLHKDTVTHSTAVSELARSKITFAVQELDPLNINDSEVLNAQLKRKSASDSPILDPCQTKKRPRSDSTTLQASSPFQTSDVWSDDNAESNVLARMLSYESPVIINDTKGLKLGLPPRRESRWHINGIDVSEKWHQFKEKSLELATKSGLLVESHAQEILSLSHILLLKPRQHSPLMVEVFGEDLLEMMHRDMLQRFTKQETEFDFEIFTKLMQIVKRLQQGKFTRNTVVAELQKLMNDCSPRDVTILKAIRNIIERVPRTALKSPLGEVELCMTYIDPVLSPIFADPDHDVFLRWSNKEAPESKARKLTGRAKQPDAIISNVDQLSWGSSRGHGEAKVQEEVDNLYSLCTDLIRIAVFNKDAIDFYNKDCMLGFQVIGSHITFYLSTLLYDSLYVMIEIGHLNVPMSLEQLPAFITSLDTLLVVSNAFWTNCAMSHPAAEMEPNKRNTLATPNFKELIAKSRDRHRPCQLQF